MSKKPAVKLSPAQIAEAAKPNWKAVSVRNSVDSTNTDNNQRLADAVVPELETQQAKYGRRSKQAPAGKSDNLGHGQTKDLCIVLMEPKEATDSHIGRKAVLIEDDQIIGEQG